MNKLLTNLDVIKKHGKSQPVISHIALAVAWLTCLCLLLFCPLGCAKMSSSDVSSVYGSIPNTPVVTPDYPNAPHVSGFTGISTRDASSIYGSVSFTLILMPDYANAPHVSGFTGIRLFY